jgi:hypothetical protein
MAARPGLRFQSQVRPPPPLLLDRFYQPTLAVARVWLYLARFLPIEVTSWWRDPSRNASAGGQDYSQHLVGTAIDAKSPGLSRAQLLPYVAAVGRVYGVSVPAAASEGSGASVHVQGLPYGLVRELLTRDPQLIERATAAHGPPRPTGV